MTRTEHADDAALCAHDLRGALSVITGYIDLLQRPDLNEPDRVRAFAGIEAAVVRANALLDRLAGSSGSRDSRELVDLRALAETAAQDAHVASGRSVIVHAEGRPSVHGDPVSLGRVFQNLLDNAVHYASTGPIEVTVGSLDDKVVVKVADRGPGIPAAERERVLEPHVRLQRDEATQGSGLGLTVVRRVVADHGGELCFEDRPRGGLIVRIELPED